MRAWSSTTNYAAIVVLSRGNAVGVELLEIVGKEMRLQAKVSVS